MNDNTTAGPSFYDILGVSSDARQDEVKRAYLRAAKQYHPDVNPSPSAKTRMQRINEAYEVLGNATRRAAYDSELQLASKVQDSQRADTLAYATQYAQEVRCQGCRKFDHTLRLAAFPTVMSFIIVSSVRHDSGVYCHNCRSQMSFHHAMMSLLLGPWSIPGFFLTIGALITNFGRGHMPRESNRELLVNLAWVNAGLGNMAEAKAALRDSLKLGYDEKAKSFADELERTFPSVIPARVSGLYVRPFALVVAVLGLAGIVAFAIPGINSNSGTISPLPPPITTPTPVYRVTPAAFYTTIPQPTPPDRSFAVWDDKSGWTDTGLKISGTVKNTHGQWAITEAKVKVEILDKSGFVVHTTVVNVSPTRILPGTTGVYNKTLVPPDSGQNGRTVLEWLWEPPS